MPAATIGSRVRARRKQRGWTQATLAAKVGVSSVRISQIEHADVLHTRTLARLAEALGCEAGDLLEDER